MRWHSGRFLGLRGYPCVPALTQALRSRWDTEASAFAFPWGHMIPSLEDVSRITGLRVYGRAVSGYTYPCYHDLDERLLDLPVERRSSLVPRVALQESLGLFEAGKNVGETEDEYLERLARVSRRELASELGPQADLDLRRFLVLFLSRLLFATRGDAVHCRFLPLLADLDEVGGSSLVPRVALQESLGLFEAGKNIGETEDEYLERLARVSRRELASEPGPQADLDLRRFLVLFLSRLLFATRGDAVHCRFLPLLADLDEVGGYAWGAAFLAHQFDVLSASERQTSTSGFYPFLQLWSYLHLPSFRRGELTRPGLVPIARRWDSRRDTRHLADQLDHLQEAIDSYAYLDPYLGEGDEGQPWLVQARPYFGRSVWLHALNLVLPLNLFLTQRSLGFRQSVMEFPVRDRFRRPGRSFRGLHDTTDWRERAREQIENWERKGKGVDVTGEIASLRALLQSAWSELERVRGAGTGGASSSRSVGGSPSLMEARLAGAVLRAEEAQRHLEEREIDLELAHE
ncbi:hypothetical protein Taro_038743 [Colocasia esculenta]|uniref:Aminotransferase-like plant mobile domain-containing protein n=1 Tax=Colocasia esculenta TaxID=4460 RepID=A0A843WEQ8_COLES|nr:hypothetical protein [Colocasia esculenta]